MRYIIFSDMHLHNYSGEIDSKTRLSKKLLIQKDILQQIIDVAIQQDATILFGGDFCHSVGTISVEVMNMIDWFFKEVQKCGINFYSVLGNHDISIRKNCSTWHSVLSPFQNREVRNKELMSLKPSIRFVDYDQIDEVENITGFDILLVHAQPDLVNKHKFHMEGINWKKLAKNNRLVFFGHDHTRRELSKTCFVVGSPMQLTANDIGEDRGCYIVDSENWSVTFHKLEYPELQRIEKVEAKDEPKYEERIKATSFQDILVEWINRENKPQSYLDLIQSDINDKLQITKTFFDGKIKTVYLKDFLSVEEITVELKNGFWLVMGENGTGKTTITGEGIYWILFDESTKGLAKSEIVRDRPTKQKEAIGELFLVSEKNEYLIHRSSKTGLEIIQNKKNLVDGMTKIQAQEFLEKNILGFDKNTYLTSCYFSQEKLLTLAQLGDADTTNLVTNLLGFETYDNLHVLMDLKIKENTLQKQLIEESGVKLNHDIFINELNQRNIKEQIEMFTKQECSLKDEQSKITIQISELTTLLGNLVIPVISTEAIDVSLLALNDTKSEMTTKQKKSQDDGHSRTQDLRKQLTILQKDLATILQEQNKIDKEKSLIGSKTTAIDNDIIRHEKIITSLKENKCSYCGTILNKEELAKHITNEQNEIAKLSAEIVVWNPDKDIELNSLYDKEATTRELIDNINLKITESDAEIKASWDANFAEITKIDCDIQELQSKRACSIKEQAEIKGKKELYEMQIKSLNGRLIELANQLQQVNINDKLLQLKDLEEKKLNTDAQKLDIEDKIRILNENLVIYEFWKNSFSNKGIRPLLLDKFVNDFNKIVKQYCYKVSNGEFIVEFTPTSKIRSGLERNKLGLQVIYKDKTVNYSSLSGGEKTRINLPLCFGLNKWISNKYGIMNGIFGLMILDELFAHLDSQGRDNIAELLNDEGKNKSIFIIDHNDTLCSYTDKLWIISKENEVTQLQVI